MRRGIVDSAKDAAASLMMAQSYEEVRAAAHDANRVHRSLRLVLRAPCFTDADVSEYEAAEQIISRGFDSGWFDEAELEE